MDDAQRAGRTEAGLGRVVPCIIFHAVVGVHADDVEAAPALESGGVIPVRDSNWDVRSLRYRRDVLSLTGSIVTQA